MAVVGDVNDCGRKSGVHEGDLVRERNANLNCVFSLVE